MEADRVYNFNPGPATLPLEVLKEAQAEFLNFNHSGMSILEISHRAPQYAAVHEKAKQDIKELMGLGDDYEVLFCQGGASQQFAMIPLNYATKEHLAPTSSPAASPKRPIKKQSTSASARSQLPAKKAATNTSRRRKSSRLIRSLPTSTSVTTTRSTARNITTSRRQTACRSLPTCPRTCSRARWISTN